jgi:hypothetical protein
MGVDKLEIEPLPEGPYLVQARISKIRYSPNEPTSTDRDLGETFAHARDQPVGHPKGLALVPRGGKPW